MDCRIERRVAAVAASVLLAGNVFVPPSDFSEDEDGDVEMTLSDCRTAREERSEAIVDANAWMES